MKIDVTELRRRVGRDAEYRFADTIGQVDMGGGESVEFAPVDTAVKLLNTGDSIAAYFGVRTNVKMTCSRCLCEFWEPLETDFEIVYRQGSVRREDADSDFAFDEDVVEYQGDLIDVSDDVRQQVLLVLPMKPVCSPTCKGLCKTCGKNLNEGECDCQGEDIDVRLSVLRDLLK